MAETVLDRSKLTPAPVTLEGVMAEVNKLLDTKLAAGFNDFKKAGLGEAVKAQLDPINAQMTTINEALGRLVASSGTPPPDGGGTGGNKLPPEVNAQLRSMGEQLKSQGTEITTLKSAKENAEKRAEETERFSTIRTSLGGLPFVNDAAAGTAFEIVKPYIRRLDDGALVATINGSDFPVNTFVKDYLDKDHGYLFKPTGSSGSGAPSTPGGMRLGAKFDSANIKVGMKPEDRAAAIEAISQALQPA